MVPATACGVWASVKISRRMNYFPGQILGCTKQRVSHCRNIYSQGRQYLFSCINVQFNIKVSFFSESVSRGNIFWRRNQKCVISLRTSIAELPEILSGYTWRQTGRLVQCLIWFSEASCQWFVFICLCAITKPIHNLLICPRFTLFTFQYWLSAFCHWQSTWRSGEIH